jgi:multicomponent Na+:H+ antiporter subunit D
VITEHLPVLMVVIPIMAAPLCVILRSQLAGWTLATAASAAAFACAIGVLMQVLASGAISYEVGGWPPPWGIEIRIDAVGAFVCLVVTAIGTVATPYMWSSVEREIPAARQYLFYCMYLLCLAGLLGMTITGDAFNLFVFLEVSSLSTYTLIALGRDRRCLTASYRYLIMGTVGATFYVIGVGLMYMMTGTLNMMDLAARLPAVADTRTIQAALAFLVAGLGLKLAMFPLHMWLPNAYAFAPSAVTVFIAATSTKVAVYAFIRVIFTVFGGVELFETVNVQELIMVLAIVGMFAGSAVAIWQTNLKRLMAYSSVAQVGYMLLGISFASVTGLAGGIVHIFNHAMMKGGIFMALGAMMFSTGSVHIKELAGIGRTMPATTFAFVLGGLSLIGVPLTAGFVSKWYLVRAALEADAWPVAVLILLSSLLAVIYVWRVVEHAYFRDPGPAAAGAKEAPLQLLIPTYVLIGASIWFGVDADFTGGLAEEAARVLLGEPTR